MAASILKQCRVSIANFKGIVSSIPAQSQRYCPLDVRQVGDDLERFGLWMGNIGALHRPELNLSLESRLREDQRVLDRVREILDDLAEVTGELLEISSGQREGEAEFTLEVQDGKPKDETNALLVEIQGCIARLFRISSLIRRVETTDLFAKALSRDRYRFTDEFDIAHVGHKYPKLATTDSAWLRRRLGRAITQRRHYLSYTQDHRGKLEGGFEDCTLQPGENVPIANLPSTHAVPDSSIRPSTFITKASTLEPGRATAAMPTVFDDIDEGEDQKSYTTVTRSVENDMEVPITNRIPRLDELPKGPDNQVECLFCFRMKRFRHEKAWHKHVLSDLRAYICTFPECEGEYFGDINEWFRHEMSKHRVKYLCSLCPTLVYQREEQYLAHVNRHHPMLLEHGDKKPVLEVARRPVEEIPAQACVFCTDWVDRIRNREDLSSQLPDDAICVSTTIFKRHLASHLEQLAVFAIPLGSGATEADSNAAMEAVSNVASRRSDCSTLEFSSSGNCDEPGDENSGTSEEVLMSRLIQSRSMTHEEPWMPILIDTFINLHRWDEAMELGMRLQTLRMEKFSSRDPFTMKTMAYLVSMYTAQNRWDDAEDLATSVFNLRKGELGIEHPDTQASMAELELILQGQRRLGDAMRAIQLG